MNLLGLATLALMHIVDTLVRIQERGTAILLVEQNAAESLLIAGRKYVFETSNVVLAGTREHLVNDEEVKQSYSGHESRSATAIKEESQ
jgi:branched-chain amino acid transport system ATP-binding protein